MCVRCARLIRDDCIYDDGRMRNNTNTHTHTLTRTHAQRGTSRHNNFIRSWEQRAHKTYFYFCTRIVNVCMWIESHSTKTHAQSFICCFVAKIWLKYSICRKDYASLSPLSTVYTKKMNCYHFRFLLFSSSHCSWFCRTKVKSSSLFDGNRNERVIYLG